MDYDIVSALSVSELCRLVNEKIGEGWTPLGGVGIGGKLYQAMTRYVVVPDHARQGKETPFPGVYIMEAQGEPDTSTLSDYSTLNVINARMLAR